MRKVKLGRRLFLPVPRIMLVASPQLVELESTLFCPHVRDVKRRCVGLSRYRHGVRTFCSAALWICRNDKEKLEGVRDGEVREKRSREQGRSRRRMGG